MRNISLHWNISIRGDSRCRKAACFTPSLPSWSTSALRSAVPIRGTRAQGPIVTALVLVSLSGEAAALMEGESLGRRPSLHVMLPTNADIDLGVTVQQSGRRVETPFVKGGRVKFVPLNSENKSRTSDAHHWQSLGGDQIQFLLVVVVERCLDFQ